LHQGQDGHKKRQGGPHPSGEARVEKRKQQREERDSARGAKGKRKRKEVVLPTAEGENSKKNW